MLLSRARCLAIQASFMQVTLRAGCRRAASQLNSRINFPELDAKWQSKWVQDFKTVSNSANEKSYVLPMFAYPSGSLHMGHLRVYTISDVIARYRRLKGYDVLHPTGWDAFGLPAENAAIERGVDPGEWTLVNIEKMKQQLKSMNTHFDWDAEISTCSPSFYKHTQKLFLMLYQKGLAYQAEALVNFDPVDKTVLANEQVDSNGRSWRSGALVQQIMLRQWFFRITEFQEELLQDLDKLAENNSWPERVLMQQKNWIGRSQGAQIQFTLTIPDHSETYVKVFTTRPDTLFGVKYLALSLSHPVVQQLADKTPDLQKFLDRRASFPPDSKDGFLLPVTAVSPVSQLDNTKYEPIPVFAAPYVLDGYGEGAVMGVPGHDTRDLAFWKLHRPNDTALLVVQPKSYSGTLRPQVQEFGEAYTGSGVLTKLCGPYEGINSREAASKIVEDLTAHGLGKATKTWRLRDWLVSRQRYWGTPIPIIHCHHCGPVPVSEKDLPVQLPKLDSAVQGQTGNPLDRCLDWVNTKCPSCGGAAKRETDTMDTFVDSSWYYMRFPDPKNETQLFSPSSAASMLPVDTYVGGVEHAILHLLYARFIYKFLCREGLVQNNHIIHEPFSQLIAQGMVHGKTFSDPDTGRFLLPHELDHNEAGSIIKSSGKIPNVSYEKMSKSKYNGVDPSTCFEKYGADATRAHILFAAPVSEVLQWDEEKIVGIQRWFQRIIRIVEDNTAISPAARSKTDLSQISDTDAKMLLLTQATWKSVTETFETNIYGLNTYISDLIKLTNGIFDKGVPQLTPWVATTCTTTLIKMLAPVAPAFADECWEQLSQRQQEQEQKQTISPNSSTNKTDTGTDSIFNTSWPPQTLTPQQETQLLSLKKTMTCAVQINGKLRFTTQIPVLPFPKTSTTEKKKEDEQNIVNAVLESEGGKLWLTQKNDWGSRKRVVVVGGGKVVNVVF